MAPSEPASSASSAQPRAIRSALPPLPVSPADSASESSPVTALREPPRRERALAVVRRFFRAALDDRFDELQALTKPEAKITTFDKKANQISLLNVWQARMRSGKLQQVGPALPIDIPSMRIHDADDAPAALLIHADEKSHVFVHVRLTVTGIDGKQVLPRSAWFSLVPDRESFLIDSVYEEPNQ